MSSRSSWHTAQLMPSRTISKHPIPRLHDLGDDLREHVLDAHDRRRSEPTEVQSASALAKSPIELLPACQDRLVELLIGLGELGDVLAPADRFPCPVDERQFLAVGVERIPGTTPASAGDEPASGPAAGPSRCGRSAPAACPAWRAGGRRSRPGAVRTRGSPPRPERRWPTSTCAPNRASRCS